VPVLETASSRGSAGGVGIGPAREYIIDLFDLGRDIAPFYALLKKDKRLAYMVEEYKDCG